MAPGERALRLAGPVAGVALGIALAGTQFPAAGNDDSHITYWSAYAVAHFGQILNYNGLPVEQSSSLFLVVLLAALERLTPASLPTIGWSTSILAALFTVVAVGAPWREKPALGRILSPLFLGSWLPFLYWSTSGMEMTLVCLLGWIATSRLGDWIDGTLVPRGSALAALVAAPLAFVLVRPETPLELLAMLGAAAGMHGVRFALRREDEARKRCLRSFLALAAALGAVVAIALIRLVLFDRIVPNSAAAKTGAFALSHGLSYLVQGFVLSGWALPCAAAIGAVFVVQSAARGRAETRVILLSGWGVSALAFVVASGGDWMAAGRLLVPLGVPLAVLAGASLERLAQKVAPAAYALAAIIVVMNVMSALSFAKSPSNGSYPDAVSGASEVKDPQSFAFSELANRAHRRDARLLTFLLAFIRKREPTDARPLYLMSGQAGMVPYHVFREFYGRVRFIDLYALTTPEIVRCIPRRMRQSQVQGIQVSPSYVIDHGSEQDPRCGLERPQIVFSTGVFPDYLRKRGYRRMYQGPPGVETFVAYDESAN